MNIDDTLRSICREVSGSSINEVPSRGTAEETQLIHEIEVLATELQLLAKKARLNGLSSELWSVVR